MILEPAALFWDENGQPESTHFGDIYFSRNKGLAETRYVFIAQNRLPERFAALNPNSPPFTIAETGFGTGLNFLCAVHTFAEHAPDFAHLHFVSVEKHPLRKSDLERALQLWPELANYANDLIAQYPMLFSGFYNLYFLNGRVRLTLLLGDACEQLPRVCGGYADAWFLDGFAPSKNPTLWDNTVLREIARLCRHNTTFATFTAASHVNKTLTELGFSVRKIAGFAGKREMLVGHWPHVAQPCAMKTYFQLPRRTYSPHAIIIGAGLAGCSSAYSLAKRGWHITLLDEQSHIAQGSSGNLQGILYARLSAFNNTPNKFTAQAYQHSLTLLNSLYGKSQPDTWSACGVLQLACNAREQKRFDELKDGNSYPHEVLTTVDAQYASQLANTTLHLPAIYFPHAGWVHPPSLCESLVKHPLISVRANVCAQRIEFDDIEKQWLVFDAQDQCIERASVVIIATNMRSNHFTQTAALPLKNIRGQVTHLSATATSQKLSAVVCGQRYLAPARHGQHCLGASFNLHEATPLLREEDHAENLAALAADFPDIANSLLSPPLTDGRVGFRTTTPDYMPIVGPVAVETDFVNDYPQLRHNANARFEKQGSFYPGLFINTAHGSRGLLTCPLSAELLAAYIQGEILPVEKDIAEALHPARFVVKDMTRGLR